MAHYVNCIYCKMRFDRDKTKDWVQISERRYAHTSCADKVQVNKTKNELDYEKLTNYIEKLFGVGYVNAKIAKQIKDFRETYGYTYSGMLGTLTYWFEVRGASLDKANGGIGIIPYIYDQARDYYSKIETANSLNADVANYKTRFIEIAITPPRPEEKIPKLFNLEEEEEEENEWENTSTPQQ